MDRQTQKPLFRSYLEDTGEDWNYILPQELQDRMQKNDPLFILDVRRPEDFAAGHIPTSMNIFWLDLLRKDNLARLPKDREIIIVCYIGHTASQALVLLKLLGFKAKVLKFGMGRSPDPEVPILGWRQYHFPMESD